MLKCSIDWDFIESLEGTRTSGYIPSKKSGVTIGSGFDIGQHSKAELYSLDLPLPLLNKLLPYVGLEGFKAQEVLDKKPLSLTKEEVQELEEKSRKTYKEAVEEEYDTHSDFKFAFLDSAKQTVIMSVAFQYGSLKTACPRFFGMITNGHWTEAVAELRHFGDSYRSRRLKEANLLEASLIPVIEKGPK
jgi:GH24 family phage-related lysozyme (muramidase)